MLGDAIYRHDVGEVYLRGGGAGKLNLCFLSRFLQSLQCHRVLAQVDSLIIQEFSGQPVDNAVVEVVPAQVGIAIGRFHFKNAVTQLQDRDIKGTPTQVEYGDLGVFVFCQARKPTLQQWAH